MRRRLASFAAPLLVALVLVTGCRSAAPGARGDGGDGGLRVVLVRHAETAPDGTRDPALSDAGRARAERLAERLPDDLVAVFATEYRRTQATAAPAAARSGREVTIVPYGAGPAEGYASALADRLRAHLADPEAAGGTVLVVGHSNTTPALAAALTGAPVPPIDEGEYDRVITVRLGPEGGALLPAETY